jgi:hypothetical protein
MGVEGGRRWVPWLGGCQRCGQNCGACRVSCRLVALPPGALCALPHAVLCRLQAPAVRPWQCAYDPDCTYTIDYNSSLQFLNSLTYFGFWLMNEVRGGRTRCRQTDRRPERQVARGAQHERCFSQNLKSCRDVLVASSSSSALSLLCPNGTFLCDVAAPPPLSL